MFGTELRKLSVHRKEKNLIVEADIAKLESEVDASSKRVQNLNARLEQATNNLKQVKTSIFQISVPAYSLHFMTTGGIREREGC